jgi:hypothetical protein
MGVLAGSPPTLAQADEASLHPGIGGHVHVAVPLVFLKRNTQTIGDPFTLAYPTGKAVANLGGGASWFVEAASPATLIFTTSISCFIPASGSELQLRSPRFTEARCLRRAPTRSSGCSSGRACRPIANTLRPGRSGLAAAQLTSGTRSVSPEAIVACQAVTARPGDAGEPLRFSVAAPIVLSDVNRSLGYAMRLPCAPRSHAIASARDDRRRSIESD